MSKSRTTRRPSKKAGSRTSQSSLEDAPVEAMTIAWTASVMSVFMADLATIAAHFYAQFHPASKTAPLFAGIMLLTACLLGVVSLALLAVVWRSSRLKPPKGFVAFAVLVALAPVIATVAGLTNT